MEHKRNTLKKIAGVGAVATLAPSSWTKPLVSSVILPAHAQTSPNQAPTISGVSCSFDTPTLQVGSVITMEATIADADNPISDMGWGILNSNSGLIVTGEGQFVTTTYTVVEGDVGNLVLELEVFDGTGNRTVEILCDDSVTEIPEPTVSFTTTGPVSTTSETLMGLTVNADATGVLGFDGVLISLSITPSFTLSKTDISTTFGTDLTETIDILDSSINVLSTYTVEIIWL